MKKVLSAVASLLVVAAMSVSAIAVESGSTNGTADGTIVDGKVTLDNSVIVEGGFEDGTEITVDVEPVGENEAATVKAEIEEGSDLEVISVNTVVDIKAVLDGAEVQPDGSVKITVATDGVSNQAIYVGDEGEVEELATEVTDTTISFTTTHFSSFYLVTVAENDVDPGNGEPSDGDSTNGDPNPGTGVVLAVVPAIAAAAAIVVSKKRK